MRFSPLLTAAIAALLLAGCAMERTPSAPVLEGDNYGHLPPEDEPTQQAGVAAPPVPPDSAAAAS